MANKDVLATNLATANKKAADALKGVKDALKKKDLKKYNEGMATLSSEVKDVNKMLRKVEYSKFLKEANPIIAAVKQFFIETRKVKEEKDKDTGDVINVKIDTKKSLVDLEELCDFGELPKGWITNVSHLLDLLALRETDVFNSKSISSKSFFFISQANAKKEGKTPDSNTQIVKLLQSIIDEAIFVDNGEGKNAYKCTTHDLVFIHDAVTKINVKEKCTIETMKTRQFMVVIMNVFAHCLGEAYKVKVPKSKASK